jgi:hypothetical protein
MSNWNFVEFAGLSDEDVLVILADCIIADSLEAEHLPNNEKMRRAIEWFEARRATILDAVCASDAVKRTHEITSRRSAELLAAVADACAMVVGAAAAASVAVVICRNGLGEMCSSRWKAPSR